LKSGYRNVAVPGRSAIHEFTCGAGGIASIEVIVAQIPVGRVGLEHVKPDDQDLVGSGVDSPAPIGISFYPPEEAWQVAFLAAGRRPGSLRQNALEGFVSFSASQAKIGLTGFGARE
jgi:hypothetical protein